ncbi:MAG: di-trans,poly-cis-decaprenylcistransferase [Actinobacteria bacterium]|nr:di-trans,poly-cis-decaprenylcistransferase [Actinomycetota bacterium]
MSLGETLRRPLYRIYEERLLRSLDRSRLPQHVGVIHDGHRRFARAAGLPDYAASYRVGMDKVVEFLSWCRDLEVPAVTCWLLSQENLSRPPGELEPYFEVLEGLFARLPDEPGAAGMRVRVVGSVELLPARLRESAVRLEERAGQGERRLTVALAYAGRQEIVDAVRDLLGELAGRGVAAAEMAQEVDAAAIGAHLYTADLPDPDLVIRTSGESRLSGFLLWQAAYAEYSFADVYWPAFRRVDFLRALRDFTRRERRFGR